MISPRTIILREKSKELLNMLKQNIASMENISEDARLRTRAGRAKNKANENGKDLFQEPCDGSAYDDYCPVRKDNQSGHCGENVCQRCTSRNKIRTDSDSDYVNNNYVDYASHKYLCKFPSQATVSTFQEIPSLHCIDSVNCDNQYRIHETRKIYDNMKQERKINKPAFKTSRSPTAETNLPTQVNKPLSLEQHLAAKAQMHAPTHSHSTSRCYCTQGITKVKGPQKHSVQSYGQKKHIPSRVKEQRYKAQLVSRQRAVHWAHNPLQNHQSDCFHNLSTVPSAVSKVACVNECNNAERQLPSFGRKADNQNIVNKVKTFRKTHWADCHAQSKNERDVTPKYVEHYLLNERLYLEPVHDAMKDHSGCLICLLPSTSAPINFQSWSKENSVHQGHASDFVVTLPKLLLDDSLLSAQTYPYGSGFQKLVKYQNQIPGSDSRLHSVSYKTLKQHFPNNSHALNHQRK